MKEEVRLYADFTGANCDCDSHFVRKRHVYMSIKNKCGKNSYNRLRAMLVLSRVNKHKNNKRQECRKYWCDICKAYHLTKMKERI